MDANAQNDKMETPLLLSVKSGNKPVSQLLLNYGARVNVPRH